MATIKEVMESLPGIFKSGKAKGWNRVILFDLGGEEPSKWTLTIQDGAASVEEGETTKPRLTITGNSESLQILRVSGFRSSLASAAARPGPTRMAVPSGVASASQGRTITAWSWEATT